MLGFFCFNVLQAESKSNINFQNITFSEVKTQETQQQRHFLTYINGRWCLGCQVMEETTFINQKLGQYINNESLSVKVDIHSALGKEWDKEFQITCLPTFLLFDKQGQLLDRYETTFTGTAFQKVLKQSIKSCFIAQTHKGNMASNSNAGYIAAEFPDSNEQAIIKQHIEQLELLLQKNENLVKRFTGTEQTDARYQELFSNTTELHNLIEALKVMQACQNDETTNEKVVVVAATVPYERQQPTTESTESNRSNSFIKKLYSKGAYKIQLGEYTDYKEAAAVVKRIESKFQSKKVFLLIDKKGDYSTYRVLVKGFKNQKEASDFIVALKDMGF
jgi:thioredoxin-related protein/uncharacterized protein YktA (UPF0223 family)